MQLLRRALGYPRGSILKDHLATLRPVAKPEPLIQFETDPGRQMQANLRDHPARA